MFFTSRTIRRLHMVAILGIGITTAACTDGYGYGGLDTGYAAPYYGGGYGSYYGGYANGGYGLGGFGWYGDYYYPGTGIYVYDRNRRPFRWNDNQRRYWEARRGDHQGKARGNWGGFAYRDRREGQAGYRGDRPAFRGSGVPQVEGDRASRRGGGFRSSPRSDGGQGVGGRTGGRGFGIRGGGRGGEGRRSR